MGYRVESESNSLLTNHSLPPAAATGMVHTLRPTTFYHGTSIEAAIAIQDGDGGERKRGGSRTGRG